MRRRVRTGTAVGRVEVFAVEDTAVQVVWSDAPGDGVLVRVDPPGVVAEHHRGPGPGGVVVGGLPPGTDVRITVSTGGRTTTLGARTLTPPPGEELCRVATINDLHIGATAFGLRHGITEPPGTEPPHPERCARAAIAEAVAWGAQLLLVKGDLTDESTPAAWERLGRLLAGVPVPVLVVPGNHDTGRRQEIPPDLGASAVGIRLVHGVVIRELPGLRVIAADTTVPGWGHGRISHVAGAVVDAARRARGGVLVALHHHPQRFRFPWFWPPGIPGPQARRFLADLAAATPRVLVTTGHTHRHRRHVIEGVTVTEIGSTKDYPGTWAGYAAHEGGIRQVVRRVDAPDAIAWTERTRRAVGGVWGLWSPGRLSSRCFTLRWSPDDRAG